MFLTVTVFSRLDRAQASYQLGNLKQRNYDTFLFQLSLLIILQEITRRYSTLVQFLMI